MATKVTKFTVKPTKHGLVTKIISEKTVTYKKPNFKYRVTSDYSASLHETKAAAERKATTLRNRGDKNVRVSKIRRRK